MPFYRASVLGLLLALELSLIGCQSDSPTKPSRPDTGAESVARTFFEALMHEDWAAAYNTLDSESKNAFGEQSFVKLGKVYLSQIGFSPGEVHISVTETGDQASAIAVFRVTSESSTKQFKDGTELRKTAIGWVIVLRQNFGKEAHFQNRPVKN
jgi:hypothetical protein